MNSKEYISDEILNAYIDQELDDQEMTRIHAMLAQSPELQGRLHVLQQLKILVHAAKPDGGLARSSEHTDDQKGYRYQLIVAVSVLGFASWIMWAMFPFNQHVPLNIATEQGVERTTASKLFDSGIKQAVVKVVLHVKRNERQAGESLFDQIDTLQAAAERRQATVRIEVMFNGDGLNLLRQGISPYAQQVHELRNRYDNLVFIACGDTIKRLDVSLADLRLFPEVMVVASVKQQIRLRQQQGWTVIQV